MIIKLIKWSLQIAIHEILNSIQAEIWNLGEHYVEGDDVIVWKQQIRISYERNH